MNKHFSFCISILTFVSLSYAADLRELNSRLVELAPMRVQDYSHHVEPAGAHTSEHPTSKLTLTQLFDQKAQLHCFSITEHAEHPDSQQRVWQAWFAGNNLQVVWHDEAGEHIAIRHASINPDQRIYRVSFMSVLKTLKPEQQSFLATSLYKRKKTQAPVAISHATYQQYAALPQELKLSTLFSVPFGLHVREIARTILCCRTR